MQFALRDYPIGFRSSTKFLGTMVRMVELTAKEALRCQLVSLVRWSFAVFDKVVDQ